VTHAAVVVADLEIRVVVLDIRDMRERVDETHRAPEIRELELAANRLAVLDQLPAGVQEFHHPGRLVPVEWPHAALAGHTLAFLQGIHQASLRAKRRAT